MSAVAKWHNRSVRRERLEAVAEARRFIVDAVDALSWPDWKLSRRLAGTGLDEDMAGYRSRLASRVDAARALIGYQS